MDIEFGANIIKIENNDVTLRLSFLTPDIISCLEEFASIDDGNLLKVKIKGFVKKTKQHFQQKCWYGSLKMIMEKLEIPSTKETLHLFDEELRKSIFPAKFIDYGKETTIPYVPRMKDLSFEEMNNCIVKLHERYSYLNIDFSQI